MAVDNFSYKDSIRAALASCMPCFSSIAPVNSNDNTHNDVRTHRSPSNELEGLLRDTNTEIETLSLHSNIGAGRRKPRKRPAFSLTLFGYTLFGRPPIYLSDDEDERGWRRRALGTASSSTLDSDAAPLDASTIARMSSPDRAEAEQHRRDEEAQRKAERKARRRERKERERMSTLLSLNGNSLVKESGFEGFQGSGESAIPSLPASEFGPFVRGQEELSAIGGEGEGSEDVDDADLGGELYTRKKRHSIWSGSGSDSRSRTSASVSNGDANLHYNHHQPELAQAVPPSYPQTEMQLPNSAKKSKHRTSKRFSPLSSSTASQSTAPYTPAPSISVSPAVAAFPVPHERMGHAIEGGDVRGFPSVGLSSARGKPREMGVFLASREAAQS
ncbi:uncharacterized protein F5147DRAFT_662156 [Suillus discolor]|uniref:Uncharacterized protein n=1 Tax=Suillus discolor TaxID=1912936 RepID=A0A9P7FMF8_9AGAM|nr:uncharacterized protein F5147DRAFT_662156 [Suillus discolor]KAG2120493.1 hypothetical protein F5147DRAFT_662156 [Suillus discolor]